MAERACLVELKIKHNITDKKPKKPKKKAEEKEAEPEVEVGFAELSDDEGLREETFDDLDFDVEEIPFSDSEEESESEEEDEDEEGEKKGNEDKEGEEKGKEANNKELQGNGEEMEELQGNGEEENNDPEYLEASQEVKGKKGKSKGKRLGGCKGDDGRPRKSTLLDPVAGQAGAVAAV